MQVMELYEWSLVGFELEIFKLLAINVLTLFRKSHNVSPQEWSWLNVSIFTFYKNRLLLHHTSPILKPCNSYLVVESTSYWMNSIKRNLRSLPSGEIFTHFCPYFEFVIWFSPYFFLEPRSIWNNLSSRVNICVLSTCPLCERLYWYVVVPALVYIYVKNIF